MFHPHHHRSAFPLIVTGLTLALLLGVALLFGPTVRDQSRGLLRPNQVGQVADYERNAGRVMAVLDERLELAEDNDARSDVVGTATSELLELLVPASHQGIHLNLVTSLDVLRRGFREGDLSKIEEGERRLEALYEQYPWL